MTEIRGPAPAADLESAQTSRSPSPTVASAQDSPSDTAQHEKADAAKLGGKGSVEKQAQASDENLVCWDETPRDGKSGPLADPTNPQGWSTAKKWSTLVVVAASSTCVTCTSSVVTSAYGGIEQDLGVSEEVAILGLSLFVLGLGMGPMLLAPLSEFFGRRPVYLISFGAFCLLGLPVSFANHFSVFVIFRFLTGFMGSAFLSIAGGTVADLFAPRDAFIPMAVYTLSPFLGPILGPLMAGFIAYNTTWRWVFWLVNIWSAVMWVLIFVGVPETFAPIILTRRAERLRKETGNEELHSAHELVLRQKSIAGSMRASSTKVIQLLVMEPMLLLLCIWSALLLGILYLLFEAFPIVFMQHGFKLWQTGLTFIGIMVGMFAAGATMPYWSRRYIRAMEANGGQAPPEARLPMAMVGAVLAPISLFWFAFTTYPSVHWIVPIIASVPFGAAVLFIYTAIFSFTTDTWRPVAASGMGANSLMRSLFACVFPLFANQMYRKLGTVGASALLAGLNVLMVPVPFLFYRYGARIRARSRFTF